MLRLCVRLWGTNTPEEELDLKTHFGKSTIPVLICHPFTITVKRVRSYCTVSDYLCMISSDCDQTQRQVKAVALP